MLLLAFTLADVVGNLAEFAEGGWASTGLVASVLGWVLLRHLPEQDRQKKELLTRHDETVRTLVDAHTSAMEREVARCDAGRREAREDYRRSLEAVCEPMSNAVAALSRMIEKIERRP